MSGSLESQVRNQVALGRHRVPDMGIILYLSQREQVTYQLSRLLAHILSSLVDCFPLQSLFIYYAILPLKALVRASTQYMH